MTNRPTREKYKLNLQIPKSNQVIFCTKSLRYSGSKVWNSLPCHTKSSENLIIFKILIKNWNGTVCSCKISKKWNYTLSPSIVFGNNIVEVTSSVKLLRIYIYDQLSFNLHSNNICKSAPKQRKACVRYFLSNFYFLPNCSPLKTMENIFHFIKKALFVLEIFKFLQFFPFLSTLPRFKKTNGSGIIYDVINWLA